MSVMMSDASISRLVGEYLEANSHLSYVDIDAMAQTLQTKSFRFARMKKDAFRATVERAFRQFAHQSSLGSGGGGEEVEEIEILDDDDPPPPKKSKDEESSRPLGQLKLENFGASQDLLVSLERALRHVTQPEVFAQLGVLPPRGILLHGPPGTGKSLLASTIACDLEIPFVKVAGPELVGGVSGDSEKKIREIFNTAEKHGTCVLFIDEIDSVAIKRDSSERGMERRMVAQLCSSIDLLNEKKSKVVLMAATSEIHNIDLSLRRAGRFDREIQLGLPDAAGRERILKVLTRELKFEFDLKTVARETPGFVAADLQALLREAALCAVDAGNLKITKENVDSARKEVQPSAKREGFATVPDVTWDDVGALEELRQELKTSVLGPVFHREAFEALGLSPAGILLHGPPGCGKTLLAKAVANEAGVNFISVKGPELVNKYVGESERGVRETFSRARNSAPCVVFFDEIDAICGRRNNEETTGASRLVNQMLTELDGIQNRNGVFVMAATNRIELIDPAVLRPGRFDKKILVPLPSLQDRAKILHAITKGGEKPKISGVSFDFIANHTEGFSGADLAGLVREASSLALRDHLDHGAELLLFQHHFQIAIRNLQKD